MLAASFVDFFAPMSYYRRMKKYNFVTWWLDLPVKPLPYRIWKMIVTPVVFIAWVVFVAVYSDYYWQFSLCAILPVAAVDFIWDGIQYGLYKKGKLKPREKKGGRSSEKTNADETAQTSETSAQ